MIWYANANPSVVGGAASGTGAISFTNASAGAFSIPLSQPITPARAIFNAEAARPGVVGTPAPLTADAGQLPVTLSVLADLSALREVTVSITSYTAAAINGTITGNTLNPGDVAILSAEGFA